MPNVGGVPQRWVDPFFAPRIVANRPCLIILNFSPFILFFYSQKGGNYSPKTAKYSLKTADNFSNKAIVCDTKIIFCMTDVVL